MSAHVIEPVADDDGLTAWVALHNRVVPARAQSLADVVSHREAVGPDVIHLLAAAGGNPVGAGFAGREPGRPAGLAEAGIAVLSEHAGRGVGSALLAALSAWADERGLDALEGFVEEADEASLAWAERRGFRAVVRESRLVLELGGLDPPEPALPAGVEIATLAERPELARGVYEVACESYPDIPGNEDDEIESFEDWLAHDLGGSGDRPEAVFLALAGDDVVGYSKFHLTDARPGVATHDVTGVRRAWRGRGVAGALKRRQIAWAREAGYRRLETMNEVRNVPIRRLNQRLGYRLAPGRVLVRGPLFHSARNGLQSE